MIIGEIEGVPVGSMFENRQKLHDAGVHRATQAGITGRAADGAESIVLSGGYVDDEDDGDEITYTGHGGRDPDTGSQVADQEFARQNQALVTSCLNGLPLRVIRGAGHRSPFSPVSGYRYDGLFWVDRYWRESGQDGFLVCRYRLVSSQERRGDTPPPTQPGAKQPARVQTTVLRVVRDTALGRRLKMMHGYACQVCGTKLECEGGPYAEAAHIRPLGRPHDGPDVLENLLCLCPNHHVLFDNGGFAVNNDLGLVGLEGRLATIQGHSISSI